ncbi:MAG TPA: hypothetical protein VN667_07985, partial [Burkholderiales bacterium]|nr:hypothetical protein [Burkholderiales bacterium]
MMNASAPGLAKPGPGLAPTSALAAPLALAFGLRFEDLYAREGLLRVDAAFTAALRGADAALEARLAAARQDPAALETKAESALLLDIAPHLERFIAELFGIVEASQALAHRHDELAPLYEVKRKFVQRHAVSKYKPAAAQELDGPALEAELQAKFGGSFSELAFARHVTAWQADEAAHAADLDLATRYAAWALQTPGGQARSRAGVLFKAPAKTDPLHLLHHAEQRTEDGVTKFTIRPEHIRRREGFALTDHGTDLVGALDQANYCIWCHKQGKDSCSKGLKEKPDAQGKVQFKKSPFGVTLAGCPLEEKISEFHMAKTQGLPVTALAIITVDNPMAAATGHRICNDCMKACIYQKQ